MDIINITENQPYIISLDNLDLQYMARNVHKTNEDTLPIWNKKPVDSYYEFQVICNSEHTSGVFKSEDKSEKFLCHICNIQVPIQFIKEHYESDKHKTFIKITEAALGRAAKNINIYVETKNGNVSKNTYYCGACSEIVYSKNVHNSSKKHLKSIKFDEAIKCLLNLYLDINAIEHFNVIETDRAINSIKNVEIDTDEKSNENEKGKITIETDKKVPLINKVMSNPLPANQHLPSTSKPLDLLNSKITNDSNDFESYIDDMARKYKLLKPKIKVAGDSVLIYSAKGESKEVSIEKFHGFVTNNQGVFCKVCQEQAKEDIYIHKRNKKHVTNILKPLDENFTRQVNEDWYHCVICNKIILGTEFHCTIDVEHKKNLGNVPEPSSKPSQPKDVETIVKSTENGPDEKYCKSCDRYIHTHNFAAHINSKKHKEQAMSYANIVASSNPIKTPDFVSPDYMTVSANPNQSHCNICEVNVPNTSKNISEHINASKHKGNLSSILDKNKIEQVSEGYQCAICSIKTNNLIDHIKTETHLLSVTNFCFVCNVKVPSKGMDVHKLGKPHREKLLSSVTTSDVQSITSNSTTTTLNTSEAKVVVPKIRMLQTDQTKNEKELLCRICETIIPNKNEHINEHFEGKRHINNCTNLLAANSITEYLFGYKCELCGINKIEDVISHIKNDSHKHLLSSKSNTVKNEYCSICEKNVLGLSEHENEFSHEIQLYGLLKNNKIDDKDSEYYYCNLCEFFFYKQILTIHIKSTVHTDKVKQISQVIQLNYCELCKENVDIMGHEESFAHTIKEHGLRKNNRMKKQDNHFYCEPCEQTIFKFSLLLHIENSKHINNLEKFNNTMKSEYCDICQNYFKEYEHQYQIAHTVMLNNLLKNNKIICKLEHYFCNLCKQDIIKGQLISHIKSEEHLSKLL